MKKMLLAIAFIILGCFDKAKLEIKEVAVDNCIIQCTRSLWTGEILVEKMAPCKKLYAGKKCCAFVFTNSGRDIDYRWNAGEIGRVTGCPK